MRMTYTRDQLLVRMADRVYEAYKKYEGDCMFDALAMTGFEIVCIEPEFWHPIEKEMAEILNDIRIACLEYENSVIITDEMATTRMSSMAKSVWHRLEQFKSDLRRLADPTAPSRKMSWIATEFNEVFQDEWENESEDEQQSKSDADRMAEERSIRHQQVKTHIIHIQMQTDAALRNLDKTITQLMEMYEEGRIPCRRRR